MFKAGGLRFTKFMYPAGDQKFGITGLKCVDHVWKCCLLFFMVVQIAGTFSFFFGQVSLCILEQLTDIQRPWFLSEKIHRSRWFAKLGRFGRIRQSSIQSGFCKTSLLESKSLFSGLCHFLNFGRFLLKLVQVICWQAATNLQLSSLLSRRSSKGFAKKEPFLSNEKKLFLRVCRGLYYPLRWGL